MKLKKNSCAILRHQTQNEVKKNHVHAILHCHCRHWALQPMVVTGHCEINQKKRYWKYQIKIYYVHFSPLYRPCLPSYYTTFHIKDTTQVMILPFDYIGYKRLSENKRFPNHRWYSDATWGGNGGMVSIQRKTICLYVYISDIRQIVGYRTPVFIQQFPWRLHITILVIYRIYDYDMMTLSQ